MELKCFEFLFFQYKRSLPDKETAMIQLMEKGKWYLTIYNDRDQPQEIGVARRTIGKAVYAKNVSTSYGSNSMESILLQNRQWTVLIFLVSLACLEAFKPILFSIHITVEQQYVWKLYIVDSRLNIYQWTSPWQISWEPIVRVTVTDMVFVTTRGGVSVLMATGDHTAQNVSLNCTRWNRNKLFQ